MRNCYKFKLKSSGFRLVCQLEDAALVVLIIAIGKRERNEVYRKAARAN